MGEAVGEAMGFVVGLPIPKRALLADQSEAISEAVRAVL